jgi:hypothetical protein
LSDPELRCAAVKGLSSLSGGSGDPTVIDALGRAIEGEGARNVTSLVDAFLAVGGEVTELLDRVAGHVDPPTAMTIHWLRTGLGPREAAARLAPAYGLTEPGAEEIAELVAKWREEPDALHIVYGLLGEAWNRIAAFDSKDVVAPDHAKIVGDLAGITGGRFALDDVVQTEKAHRDADFQVLFAHNGVGYSLPLRNHGRYVDVRGLLDGLNGVLERLGYPERFFVLHAFGTTFVIATFARAEEFLTAVHELHIPLDPYAE